jgi:hypothetical protein
MHIHVPGDMVKDFFVGSAPPDNGQHILFMAREYRHLSSFTSFAIPDMDEERAIARGVHIAHPQVAQFRTAQPACFCKSNVCLPMAWLEVPIMDGRAT